MMRRALLRRSGQLKRRTWIRARRKEPRRSSRARDSAYLRFVRKLPCVAGVLSKCDGHVNADHAGRRGMRQKCDDTNAISLCELHHRQRDDFSGPFRTWDQAAMRAWLAKHIEETQAFARQQGALP